MKRRIHPIRHIIVIAVVVFVIFPMFWIFTTSIRRDNAAFSPELFSSQITWQNYKDLLFPTKNIHDLYNDLVNVYNLGEPYNKMNQKEIIDFLNKDFNAYDNYFKETQNLLGTISSDSSWIVANYLPKAEKAAVDNVRENSTRDMTYLATVDSYLSGRFRTLPQDYRTAGLSEIVASVKSTPGVYNLRLLSEYFPDVANERGKYVTALAGSSRKISDITGEASKLLSGIDDPNAKDLLGAYEQTYRMVETGTFSYSAWFAPVYLRRINMDTNRLASAVGTDVSGRLQTLKGEIFGMMGNLRDAESGYTAALESASSKVKTQNDALLSTLQASLTSLQSEYSDLNSKWNSLSSESLKYMSAMSEDASQVSIFANTIIPTSKALSDTVYVIKDALKGISPASDTGTFVDISAQLKLIDEWIAISSKYQAFDSITSSVRELSDDLNYIQSNQAFIASHQNLDAISNANTALPLILLKLKSGLEQSLPVLEDYRNASSEYAAVAKEIPDIQNRMKEISARISPMQNELGKIESEISLASLYFQTDLALGKLSDMHKNIGNYADAKRFLKELNTFYGTLQNSNLYASLPAFPNSDRYRRFNETEKLAETLGLALDYSKYFETVKNTYAGYLHGLRERTPSYVEMKFLGVPFSINELNTLNTYYQDNYVSKISPNLSIISRRTSDLMVSGYFGEVHGRLNAINDSSYGLTQIWSFKYIPPFLTWMFNSIVISLAAAMITVFLSALMAYPFSRMRFLGRRNGLMGILLLQMFPTTMAMVSLYLLLHFIGGFFPPLGLNSLGGLSFLYIGGGIAFNTWLIKGYFDTIPDSLEEAAMVDGATRFQTFWRIIVPLSLPILAVVTILGFVGNFNDYILASIVMTNVDKFTLAVGLQTFSQSSYQTDWGLMTTAALLGAIPILVLFLALQRFIVGGLTQGSVKG